MASDTISDHAANACIYTTYAVVLLMGCFVAFVFWSRPYTNDNGTKGWSSLVWNFIASGMGCGILLTYPQIAAYSGLHGLFVYALCGAIPMMLFALLGPIIRKKTPHGFVLTEWIRQRYGVGASLLVSCATILTVYLFMVSELTSIQAVIETLTGLKGWPALIVEACVTGIYTSLGGFQTSFFTDNLQAPAVLVLLIIVIVAMGCDIDIDRSLIGPSGLLKANLLGWKLIYILFVAIMTNDCFMAGFWLRTFASRSNRDLYIACTLAGILFFVICAGVGIPGMLAVWARIIDPASDTFEDDSMIAFFLVLKQLPKWVHGFTLVFACLLSSCTIDSFQSAMASTVSNDFCRNRVRNIWVRAFTLATLAPSIVVALQAPNVLNIYLICDILSSAIVPVLFLGLSKYFWFLTGLEIFMSLLGGIIGVFVFGTIFWHSAAAGGAQLLLTPGLYGDDWSAFGTFVVAPLASIVGAVVSIALRGIWLACSTGRLWAVFDEPKAPTTTWGRFWFGHDDLLVRHSDRPWYERWNLPSWCKTIDYIIFIQEEEESPKVVDPWYVNSGLPNWCKTTCRTVDGWVFREDTKRRSSSSTSASSSLSKDKESLESSMDSNNKNRVTVIE